MKKYTSEYSKHKYDAIIIGSGLGGLTTAAILAKEGQKVLVLERHFKGGGFTHVFKRKKYEWDIGLHYLGDLNQNEFVSKIFNYISTDPLHWESMGEIYDVAIIEGDKYEFPSGKENLISKLIGYFPDESTAINKYFELIKKLNNSSAWFFSEKTLPPFLSYFFSSSMRKAFLKYANQTTYDVISKLTSNKKLLAVLCTQCGNYGMTPMKSSFAIHALIVEHYLNGGCYPQGGSSGIYKTILPTIESHGGTVLVNAEVKSIVIENNVAIGVKMTNDDIISATSVISDIGVKNTFEKLILSPVSYLDKITSEANELKSSVSHVALYIGLNASDEYLNLPKHNFWIYSNYNLDDSFDNYLADNSLDLPLAYISFPSAKDPSWKINHPNTATIQVLTLSSFEHYKEWSDSSWMKRNIEYNNFKDELKNKLLDKVLSVVPQIKNYIDVCELSTPLTTKHFTNYQKGEIYGLEHSAARFNKLWLRPRTPIKNLFLTGQDILTVGICSTLFSGVITSIAILKKNLYFRIKKST